MAAEAVAAARAIMARRDSAEGMLFGGSFARKERWSGRMRGRVRRSKEERKDVSNT